MVDLLSAKRHEVWARAAYRNGETLSGFIRRVVDAAAERGQVPLDVVGELPTEPPVPLEVAEEPDPCLHRVFRVRVLPWGGRQCEGCGDLL